MDYNTPTCASSGVKPEYGYGFRSGLVIRAFGFCAWTQITRIRIQDKSDIGLISLSAIL